MLLNNLYLNNALILVCSYLIGAFPSAYIAGKIKGIDIRKTGSTNVGGMNIYSNVGKIAGILVIIVDMGLLPGLPQSFRHITLLLGCLQ